ncbi:DEKNAAC103819 [Brettanomyces naardenensis]|uniref:ATP-dependent DNA helicase PIF1 n=1 Tax=Brettanomyces naardenensis TaxID=13370 RepID=A0A448YPH1_BRENA|nr:DEKNAAC103819 [Brettanomyces naardenensis]
MSLSSKEIPIIDLDKENISNDVKAVPATGHKSLANQESFSQSQERRSHSVPAKTSNFKHSKPLTKHLSFAASSRLTTSQASINLSSSNSKGRKRKQSASHVSSLSKRRPLPWLPTPSLTYNPRLKGQSSQGESSSVNIGGLSNEQQLVLDAIMYSHKNVFFTGSAGTGKSFLLRTIIQRLRSRYGTSAVAVTASTGLAATNIDGTTINRFAGIGLGLESAVHLVGRVRKSRISTDRWKTTKFLIIDEISMIDAILFSKLNEVAKMVRGIEKPFGGIQLIITGDFFQLPPVSRNGTADFCFNCDTWKECIDETYLLTKIFRQSGDNQLIDMLNSLRLGRLSPYVKQQFKALERPLDYEDGILPTELYPTRDEVERANRNRLNSLAGEELTFFAKDSFGPEYAQLQGPPPPFLINLLNGLMCAKILKLKVGAQVMNLKNDMEDSAIVNGTIGKIVCFTTQEMWGFFCSKVKDYEMLIYQPLLAYASRFIGNPSADIDDKLYEEFVAANPSCLGKSTILPDLIRRAKRQKKEQLLPVVKFTVSSVDGYRLKLVEPVDFASESRSDVIRTQLPIILSWALSIHKSQGQTLNRVKVDLTRVFEKGQVYVALSRCVSTEGLEVVNFDESKVAVRKDVVRFYAKLKKQTNRASSRAKRG